MHFAGLNRCRKSCRLRWLNYLKPNIKRGNFAADEVDLMLRLHKLLGNRQVSLANSSNSKHRMSLVRVFISENAIISNFIFPKYYFINSTIPFYITSDLSKLYFFFSILFKYNFLFLFLTLSLFFLLSFSLNLQHRPQQIKPKQFNTQSPPQPPRHHHATTNTQSPPHILAPPTGPSNQNQNQNHTHSTLTNQNQNQNQYFTPTKPDTHTTHITARSLIQGRSQDPELGGGNSIKRKYYEILRKKN